MEDRKPVLTHDAAASAPTSEPSSSVKGVSFLNLLTSLRELRGDEAAKRALALAPDSVRAVLLGHELLAGGWYSGDDYRALLQAVLAAADEQPIFARDLGRHRTIRDFRGIYRLLCFVLAPEALLKRGAGIYERYRRGGKLTVTSARDGNAEALFENCRGFDHACWQDAIGAAEGVLVACGAKQLRVTILEGGGDFDTRMRFDARWKT